MNQMLADMHAAAFSTRCIDQRVTNDLSTQSVYHWNLLLSHCESVKGGLSRIIWRHQMEVKLNLNSPPVKKTLFSIFIP